MTLIKSISGIRGTIGGLAGEGLTPPDVVKYVSAYGTWLKQQQKGKVSVVIGRDARLSGEMVNNLAVSTLSALGIDCVDVGLSTTPTVEVAVTELKAQGGIIITASHNPKQWNALKLLNEKGEFINESDGAKVLAIAESASFNYADVNKLGSISRRDDLLKLHIDK
ncbi:MAG TPA: phosphoglucosamine mutase, partial [Bacteroidia bacterium]|nr:phosphoglucosamine mutase [Bacteroidia bacterium]